MLLARRCPQSPEDLAATVAGEMKNGRRKWRRTPQSPLPAWKEIASQLLRRNQGCTSRVKAGRTRAGREEQETAASPRVLV